MNQHKNILTDTFGRKHTYLRISLTERCNLRCTYCMPAEGVLLSPKQHIMTYEEIYTIAEEFVKYGVSKIRLTGGEPLVRKDAEVIIKKLAKLPVELTMTTNAVLIDKYVAVLKECKIKTLNVSLDSLSAEKNERITRRNDLNRVKQNILLLLEHNFKVKVNCVLMKGINDDEILDFIMWGANLPLHIRFIEFMPFDGNRWNLNKMVSLEEIMRKVHTIWNKENVIRLTDAPNDTAKNYKIKGFEGTFAIISSVTNPFCDSCNRLRLTANGQLKNCLFSTSESDILTPIRQGLPIAPIIQKAVQNKFKIRSGMETMDQFKDTKSHSNNRSMIQIGG